MSIGLEIELNNTLGIFSCYFYKTGMTWAIKNFKSSLAGEIKRPEPMARKESWKGQPFLLTAGTENFVVVFEPGFEDQTCMIPEIVTKPCFTEEEFREVIRDVKNILQELVAVADKSREAKKVFEFPSEKLIREEHQIKPPPTAWLQRAKDSNHHIFIFFLGAKIDVQINFSTNLANLGNRYMDNGVSPFKDLANFKSVTGSTADVQERVRKCQQEFFKRWNDVLKINLSNAEMGFLWLLTYILFTEATNKGAPSGDYWKQRYPFLPKVNIVELAVSPALPLDSRERLAKQWEHIRSTIKNIIVENHTHMKNYFDSDRPSPFLIPDRESNLEVSARPCFNPHKILDKTEFKPLKSALNKAKSESEAETETETDIDYFLDLVHRGFAGDVIPLKEVSWASIPDAVMYRPLKKSGEQNLVIEDRIGFSHAVTDQKDIGVFIRMLTDYCSKRSEYDTAPVTVSAMSSSSSSNV